MLLKQSMNIGRIFGIKLVPVNPVCLTVLLLCFCGAACSWEPPSAQRLRAIAAGGKGSHGPDGWTSREVALLPFEVSKVFAILGKTSDVEWQCASSIL